MTYAALETSAHAAQPIELYRFTLGTHKWLYTSGDARTEYLTETYEPYPLRRGAFRQTQELAKAGLEISAPRDLPLVADLVASPLTGVVLITVYRLHRGDGEAVPWWRGRVAGVRFAGSEASLDCDPLAVALRRPGLRRPAQRLCPFALYDLDCTVAGAAHALTGTLTSHTGNTVTAGAFATQPNGWWVGGKIVLEGVLRFIVGHSSDTLTLTAPVPGLPQAADFTVYPGCDLTAATCDTKFGNILNHGGAPWFPIKNPFTGDSPA